MKRSTSVTWGKLAGVALAGGLLLGGALAAVPAMAAPVPCATTPGAPNSGGNSNNGGTCNISESLSVPSTLAIAVDFTSAPIPFPSGFSNPAGADVLVLSNAVSYYVTMSSTDLTDTHSDVIPKADLSGFQYGGAAMPLGIPQEFTSSSQESGTGAGDAGAPAGWDEWGTKGVGLNTTPTVPAGTYSGTLSYTLWAA